MEDRNCTKEDINAEKMQSSILTSNNEELDYEFYKNLSNAIQERDDKTLIETLKHNNNANINYLYDGLSLITRAIMHNNLIAVHEFIKAGADCNSPNRDNQTAVDYFFLDISLTLATLPDVEIEILKELYNSGANLAMPNKLTNFTPLHSSITNHKEYLVSELLRYGASVNMMASHHLSPLHLVFLDTTKDDRVITKLLIQSNAQVNIQDNTGDTPLHAASAINAIKSVSVLLCHPRIDLSKININNQSVLALAKEKNFKEIGRMLIQHLGIYSAQGRISKQGLAQILPQEVAEYIASFLFREQLL